MIRNKQQPNHLSCDSLHKRLV